jgi:hypothetical protein
MRSAMPAVLPDQLNQATTALPSPDAVTSFVVSSPADTAPSVVSAPSGPFAFDPPHAESSSDAAPLPASSTNALRLIAFIAFSSLSSCFVKSLT